MKQVISRFFGVALAVALAVVPARAQSAAGDWDLNVESPQGAQTITMSLQLDGDKATGTLTSMVGTMPISGTVTGDKLEISGNLEAQGLNLLLGLTGNFTGDTVNGSMKVGDFGEFPFSGKRAVKTAAATPPAARASKTI